MSRKSAICRGDVGSVTQAEWQDVKLLPSCPYVFMLKAWLFSAAVAQSGVRLKNIDQLHKIIKADDAFKLEAGAVFSAPDDMRFNPANDRQTNGYPLTTAQFMRSGRHKSLRRYVGNMDVQIAQPAVLCDYRVIDRMPRRAPQVSY
jgi:hypothetical protein